MEFEVVEIVLDGHRETVAGRFPTQAAAERAARALARRHRAAGLSVHQDIRDQFWVADGLRKTAAIVVRPVAGRPTAGPRAG